MTSVATAFDYIVVGAGAAGCAVAARLSEDSAARVAIIEAGGGDGNPLLRLPGTGFLVGSAPQYNWAFQTDPVPGLNNRKLTWLQGKVLGGSSSINGMVYTRGHSRDYDAWRDAGCEGWGFADVLPFFKKAEGNARGAGPWHGADGPFKLKRSAPNLPICDAFLAAAAQAGIAEVDDLARDPVEGFGYYDVNIARGRRISAAVAYLHPAMKRPNLTVFKHTEVLRVVIEHGRAVGVEIVCAGRRSLLRAESEVILSAGAVKSPQLLMLSGIGPAQHLRDHEIPVLADAPGVGGNLQNHPCYRLQYACSAPVTARLHLKPANALKAAFDYALFRRGALAESFVTAGGFIRSDESLEIPDAQVVMLAALIPPVLDGYRPWRLLPREDGFSMTIYQGTPFSRGRISLRSADPQTQARIAPNYFDDPRDMTVLANTVERMRAMMEQPAIRGLISRSVQPAQLPSDRAGLEAEIRQNAATSYHQSGTCAMGVGELSVVDPRLRVHGVAGLRVADASIIPTLPNTALHGPTIMIGEKAAAMIREDAGRNDPAPGSVPVQASMA